MQPTYFEWEGITQTPECYYELEYEIEIRDTDGNIIEPVPDFITVTELRDEYPNKLAFEIISDS